jgi:CHAD domain-containing protein
VCRNARDTLRALRQSAGTARDTDVLISHVQKRLENASETSRPGLDFFLGFLFRQRSAAHHSLQSLAVGEFREQAERWHETRKGDHPQTFGPLAQEALRAAFSRFQNALDDNLESEAALHAVRIRGKRLRYVLEIVGPCLDRRLVEETYPQLEAMQEMLGEVNDAHTALTLITPLRSSLPSLGKPGGRYRTGLDTLLRAQQRRITQQRARFEIWQTHWRSMTHPSLDGP